MTSRHLAVRAVNALAWLASRAIDAAWALGDRVDRHLCKLNDPSEED